LGVVQVITGPSASVHDPRSSQRGDPHSASSIAGRHPHVGVPAQRSGTGTHLAHRSVPPIKHTSLFRAQLPLPHANRSVVGSLGSLVLDSLDWPVDVVDPHPSVMTMTTSPTEEIRRKRGATFMARRRAGRVPAPP
jgi:hypothetical protein